MCIISINIASKLVYSDSFITTTVSYYINPNKMHMLQSLFYLITAVRVSGVTITHLQEHKQL